MLYRLTIYLFVQKNMFVQPANESPLTASDRQVYLAKFITFVPFRKFRTVSFDVA